MNGLAGAINCPPHRHHEAGSFQRLSSNMSMMSRKASHHLIWQFLTQSMRHKCTATGRLRAVHQDQVRSSACITYEHKSACCSPRPLSGPADQPCGSTLGFRVWVAYFPDDGPSHGIFCPIGKAASPSLNIVKHRLKSEACNRRLAEKKNSLEHKKTVLILFIRRDSNAPLPPIRVESFRSYLLRNV
jgi:hypothetical protein